MRFGRALVDGSPNWTGRQICTLTSTPQEPYEQSPATIRNPTHASGFWVQKTLNAKPLNPYS